MKKIIKISTYEFAYPLALVEFPEKSSPVREMFASQLSRRLTWSALRPGAGPSHAQLPATRSACVRAAAPEFHPPFHPYLDLEDKPLQSSPV